MGDQLGQFSSTFAPQGPATVDLLKLILDVILLQNLVLSLTDGLM